MNLTKLLYKNVSILYRIDVCSKKTLPTGTCHSFARPKDFTSKVIHIFSIITMHTSHADEMRRKLMEISTC